MSVSYLQAQKKQVRVETVNVYVEDLEVDW
jgi:hypothetical protein